MTARPAGQNLRKSRSHFVRVAAGGGSHHETIQFSAEQAAQPLKFARTGSLHVQLDIAPPLQFL